MLNNLHVKNLALIDEAEVEFGEGLNILTGETGAGKSIVIGSLGFALGMRADSSAIREGAEYALVELTMTCSQEAVWALLKESGIERESDEILIQRRIYPGRSVCRINGETVTLRELANISPLLIDICGQSESLRLLKNTALGTMLDECGGEELDRTLSQIREVYRQYRDVNGKLSENCEDDSLRKRKADLAAFELEEIDNAGLKPGEDENLESDYRKMEHFSKINEAIGIISGLIDDSDGAAEAVSKACREIRSVSGYDEQLAGLESMLSDMDSMMSDTQREIRDYMENSHFDPQEFARTQERLDLINHLKDKYGRTIEDIFRYRDEKEEEVSRLQNYDDYLAELKLQADDLREKLDILCRKAHEYRCLAAADLSVRLKESLQDMNFISCELEVTVSDHPGQYSALGYDDIDFLISLNPGEPMRPLSSVASGGELSRIMLAVKCLTGERDHIGTMVFDEIDTGISGITAWKVAEKMASLSKAHQVICITHQAQIAAFADNHYLIEKHVSEGRTKTEIHSLSSRDMEKELARMMGSDETSEVALAAAGDLKSKADREKAENS